MYRTHTCGELRINNTGNEALLCGWIQRIRNMGGMTFIDLRDGYGVTQLVIGDKTGKEIRQTAETLNREFVIQIKGTVIERSNTNPQLPTGDIEIDIKELDILNTSELPPFTIEEHTDGGEELRLRHRYLDIRREPVRKALELRNKMAQEVRGFLTANHFLEVETPVLIKSTPEGARDFVVPSRIHPGSFYALPQSPQIYKQLLVIGGLDRYFQMVKCFRDEDFRADRQPEFTQIDCEMAFAGQEEILEVFENLVKHLFKEVKGIEIKYPLPRIPYADAMQYYGTDKPDTRFEMKITELTEHVKNRDFKVFNNSEYVGGICVKGGAGYSRKQLDGLTAFVQKPQVGAKGLVYVKCNEDGTFKSSIDKFYQPEDFEKWMQHIKGTKGDLLLILAGNRCQTLHALSELRLFMAKELKLIQPGDFKPLWVVDFPLLEWDEETQRFYAKHHPFTAPKPEDAENLETNPGAVRANAYDLVINGTEIGGGSVRIHNPELQQRMFKALGLSREETQEQFGFLLEAFKYGAPPHGGIAFGFDRWVALFAGAGSIRDVIAFPKNNAGRDLMANAPAPLAEAQLRELNLKIKQHQKADNNEKD